MDYINYICIIFISLLQFLNPINLYPVIRKELVQDIFFIIFTEYFFTKIQDDIGFSVFALTNKIPFHMIDIRSHSLVLQVVVAVIVLDFLRYWAHRVSHMIPFLWEIHKTHHTSVEMTAISGNRVNFFHMQFNMLFLALEFKLISTGALVMGLTFFIYSVQGAFVHSNFNVKNSFLSKILVTPNFHRWHHAEANKLRFGQNFGAIFSFWDVLFGSHFISDQNPSSLGFKGIDLYPKDWFSRMFHPLPYYVRIIFQDIFK